MVTSFLCNIWGKKTLQRSISILLSTQSLQEPRDCHGQISGSREFADQESQKNLLNLWNHHGIKQYTFFQTEETEPEENFLTFGETPSYVVYGCASVLSHAWVLLEEVIVITNQINMSFHHSLFFVLVGNDLIPLKTSYILPWRPQVTWMLLGCTICLILSPFPKPPCPLSVLLIHLDIAILYPCAGKFLSGRVAYLPSHCTVLILKHWTDNMCMCIYFP